MGATIKIRVVASVDSSVAQVFTPVVTAAERARRKVSQDLAAGATQGFAPYRTTAAAASTELDKVGAAAARTGQHLGQMASGADSKMKQLATDLKALPVDLRIATQEAQKFFAAMERERAREALGIAKQKVARDVIAHKPMSDQVVTGLQMGGRVAAGAVGYGLRAAGAFARGIGVQTDFGSMLQANIAMETAASQISASGYMPNDPRNAKRVDKGELMSEARNVGIATGYNAQDVLGGLQAFTGKTGDLQTGRDVMENLARLSKATGTNLQDMVSAAGDVSNILGDVPNKGEAINSVMKQVAGQGKLGAVEIRDMASQMAKVAAQASMFGGDIGKNIGILGALAQEARQRGGSASAQQAATSVASFANTFSKGARINALKGFGVQLTNSESDLLNDPRDIIVQSLNAAVKGGSKMSGGSHPHPIAMPGGIENMNLNMGTMFMDIRARSAVRGFENIYKGAYVAQQGNDQEKMAAATKAVNDEFDRLMRATMSESEVQESFKRAMDTTESKVNVFNNKMQEAAGEIQTSLMPAFEDLAPVVINLAHEMASFTEWLLGKKDKVTVENSLKRENVINTAAQFLSDRDAQGNRLATSAGGLPLEQDSNGEWHPGKPREIPSGMPDAIAGAISEQQAAVESARKEERALRTDAGPLGKLDTQSLQNISKFGDLPDSSLAAQSEGATAQAILAAQDKVRGAQETLQHDTDLAQKLNELLRSGALTVHVDNLPPTPPTPVKAPGASASAPADSAEVSGPQ